MKVSPIAIATVFLTTLPLERVAKNKIHGYENNKQFFKFIPLQSEIFNQVKQYLIK